MNINGVAIMNVLLINGSPRNGGTCNILKQLNEILISK